MRLLLFTVLALSVSMSNGHGTDRILAQHAAAAAATPAASPPATSAAPAAKVNLLAVMSKKGGCKAFADLVAAMPDVASTFSGNVDSGLTVFCPTNAAVAAFAPKYKNLTADGKVSLLLYHGVPVYNSLQMLKSGNGVVNTLATDGTSKNFNFTVQNEGSDVTLRSPAGGDARVTGTLLDKDPVAVYTVDGVLEPRELFKVVMAPSPAPAPDEAAADSPVAAKGKKKAPAASPREDPADQKAADESAGWRMRVGRWAAAAAAAAAAVAVAV